MAAIAAPAKNRMLSVGKTSPGSSMWIIRNAGTAISTLNSASTPNDSNEGTVLLIQLALEAIILFPVTLHWVTKTNSGSAIGMPTAAAPTLPKHHRGGKIHIIPEPVAQRRRTRCPISRNRTANQGDHSELTAGATIRAATILDAAHNSALD
jgi:hypothetical protein